MSPRRGHRNTPRWASVLCSLLVFCGIMAARFAGWLEFLELDTYDFTIALRAPSVFNKYIVLITITEKDLKTHGYPVSDAVLAQALETLTQYRPRAIGLH